MYIDQWGLPTQDNGDAEDQLQRVGMIAVAYKLQGMDSSFWEHALRFDLQPKLGVYTRHRGSTELDVTGDQLIPVQAYWCLAGDWKAQFEMRWCFAQNVRKQGEPNVKTFPDFILLRSLPFLLRMSIFLYPLCVLLDISLILLSISEVLRKKGPDDVDDNNTIITLAVCRAKFPTFFSLLALWIYKKFRPWNFGCTHDDGHTLNKNFFRPPLGALHWYHRAESGGNPEIAQLWEPIMDRWF